MISGQNNRRNLSLLFTMVLSAGFLFSWQNVATLQTTTAKDRLTQIEHNVTVAAAGRGNPHVNFDDGRELKLGANAVAAQPVALASADFDSDGIADIVTADTNGGLQLLKGIDRARFATDPAVQNQMKVEPFIAVATGASLGLMPDVLFAGDFNADGRKDVLGVVKGGNSIILVLGDGLGHFSAPAFIDVGGEISAVESGEIGKPDGQADLAVSYTTSKGSFLAIYEHPESAFKHAPEVIKLPSAATSITIGNTDGDFYSDIAVACGNDLVIVHERGHAYPWDISAQVDIKRPPAVVATRKMPFEISAMTIGRFGRERGETLAILGGDGNIHRLVPNRSIGPAKKALAIDPNAILTRNLLLPTEENDRNLALYSTRPLSAEESENAGMPYIDRSNVSHRNRDDDLQKMHDEAAERYKQIDKNDRERTSHAQAKEQRESAKEAFLETISARPSALAKWNIEMLVAGSQFANAARSGIPRKMMRVNVSDSNLDDILVLDSAGGRIQLVSQITSASSDGLKTNAGTLAITSLETFGNPVAILPTRLNLDALSDLTILFEGSPLPTVVMTAPSANLIVTSVDDTGDCLPGNPCSLRNAIIYTNSHAGVDTISISVPLVSPSMELPIITEAVNIYGSSQISGLNVPAPANGLLLRSSNSTIFALTINNFRSVMTGQSQLGGNGIAIDSTTGSPNNGNNVILYNQLGTDATGTLDKGNDAAGLNIFDSDQNEVIGNVISGNGSQQKSGAGVAVTAGNSNQFVNNIIGLNSLGTAKVGNSIGVFLTGFDNTFGGDGAGDGNTVSGNGEAYINTPSQCGGSGMLVPELINADTQELQTFGNKIKGNRLGTNPAGTVGLGNCWRAVETVPVTGTVIGSITPGGRNTVSDNGWDAIWCGNPYTPDSSSFGYCAIAGNNIGTDITGNVSVTNDLRNIPSGAFASTGVVFIGNSITLSNVGAPGGTTPNGECTGFCNLISGNDNSPSLNSDSAVRVGGPGIVGIFNSYIGTNKNGTSALSNFFAVSIDSTILPNHPTYFLGGYGLQNGQPVSLGNLISGNRLANPITLGNGRVGNYFVLGNRIGTDATGIVAVPNGVENNVGGSALNVQTGYGFGHVQIGDSNPLGRNIISGNNGNGIGVFGVNVNITNNLIGVNSSLNPLGNVGNGINIFAPGTVVGGGQTGSANVIWNNTKSGIKVNNASSVYNSLRGNSIYSNGALGIDLSFGTVFTDGDGVTANDCLDPDLGPNGFQNYPSLLSAVQNGGGNAVVTGYLRSQVAEDYDLDFYSNPTPESNNYGEGNVHIGSLRIKTNGSGFRSFQFTSVNPVTNLNITATATDSFGNTSEFSCIVGLCEDPVITIEQAEIAYGNSICADPIVVNVTGDAHDGDPLDQACDVDGNEPGLQCTLRAAMEEAQNQSGPNAITFNIPGAGIHGFSPQTPLPQMSQPVSIDASTQPGYVGTPLIVIDGQNTTNAYGIQLSGGQSVVRGFSIVNFKEQIGLGTSQGQNRITANFIGIHPTGVTGDRLRQQFGIAIVNGSSANRIGSLETQDRNIISGNGVGISINSGSNGNWILNNHIGLAPDGNAGFGNDTGIIVRGSNSNFIGSRVDSGTNVISGSVNDGILLDEGSAQNRIFGNFVGTDVTGTISIGNAHGIRIRNGAANNIIGGTRREERNVISGHSATNNSVGVLINPNAGTGNSVSGNYLGISKEGDLSLPNRVGIAVNADNQTIGNANPDDFRNLIVSTNIQGAYGIYLHPFSPNDELSNVTVQNNSVGTLSFNNDPSGYIGIFLFENVRNSTIKGNTVGHQSFAGIRLLEGPHNNTISGNRVGIKTTDEAIPNFNGIVIKQSDTNFVRDNVVSGNTSHGIVVGDGFGQNDLADKTSSVSNGSGSYAINNVITGNKVGVNNDATFVVANGKVGIGLAANARNNTVGGSGSLGNIVGGSVGDFGIGIFVGIIDDSQSDELLPHDNKVLGNRVGLGLEPNKAFLANRYGIYVRNAVNTEVGGDTTAKGNIVGNNEEDGIRLFKPQTVNTKIFNNYVGVTPNGGVVGNGGNGISVDGTGIVEINYNTVGGNLANGISLSDLGDITVQKPLGFGGPFRMLGNSVGNMLPIGGAIRIKVSNGSNGLYMERVSNGLIGTAVSQIFRDRNIFSGNDLNGIHLTGGEANSFSNNLIGTGENAEVELQNLMHGIQLINTRLNEINGNSLAGNAINGLQLENADENIIISNLIGVARDEDQALNAVGNDGNGLQLTNSEGNQIGGTQQNLGNYIAANEQLGIMLQGLESQLNKVHQNKIGIIETLKRPDSGYGPLAGVTFGNGSHGILITEGASQNQIGGQAENTGNIIANNGGSGVWIDPTAGTGNLVDPNSIFGNKGLGIDLGILGHTPNDPDDADEGANRGQNYPEIVSNQIVNNELIVTFKVESAPGNSNYGTNGMYIEFFKADLSGQGETFIGSTYYTVADYSGSVAGTKTVNLGDVTVIGINGTDQLTATASDADNNTSEFFPPFGPSAAGVSVSGRVTTVGIQGISKAVLTLTADDGRVRRVLTNGLGYFKFEDIEAGRSYALTVSHKRYVFENPSRVIMVSDDLTDVDFIASP